MPTISRTSNPTKVESLPKGAISIRVNKAIGEQGVRNFFVQHFNRDQIALAPATRIACIAAAGQTTQYFELGTVEDLSTKAFPLTELATDTAIRFRVLFYDESSSKVLAAAENVRAIDDDSSSPSLVSIQPVPLAGPLWKLEMPDNSAEEQPVLLVEIEMFSSAKAAVADPTFISFVLPEVVRCIATKVVACEATISDEGTWMQPWVQFFSLLNPVALDEIEIDVDGQKWIDDCVKGFCKRGQMATLIETVLASMNGDQK